MPRISFAPKSQINDNAKVLKINDLEVGSLVGRRFLYIKDSLGKNKECCKINDLVIALEKAVINKNLDPKELRVIYESIKGFTKKKDGSILHAVRSFFGDIGFNREAKLKSINLQIEKLELNQKFQKFMTEGKNLHIHAVRDIDGLISPLFYKDSDGIDKKFISYEIPKGKTADVVAEEIIQDLKEYSMKEDNQNIFRGHPITEVDRRFVSELGLKATKEPEKTKAALVHLILMKKADTDNLFYINDLYLKAMKVMKSNVEVEEMADRLVAQCIDPVTDITKLKKLLGHHAVKDNKKLKSVIIEKALKVQIANIRSCQISFITPLMGKEGMSLKKNLWRLKEDPINTDNLNGIRGLREIAAKEKISFPTDEEIKQRRKPENSQAENFLGSQFNIYLQNYKEAVDVFNKIKELAKIGESEQK